jgi:hypothetical protein
MTLPRFWRSWLGWTFAALYVVAFVLEYFDYLRNRGTWMADLLLDVMGMPYVLIARMVTWDPSFDLHGFQPWGLVPACLFCAALAYLLGFGLQRLLARLRGIFRSAPP